MTNDDIVEFFKNSKNVSLLPATNLFPFDPGDIVLIYPDSYHIDWVVHSLFFQENYSKTYNSVYITEKENGKIDFRFIAQWENQTVDVTATDLDYNKDKFDYFNRQHKWGDPVYLRFNCLKRAEKMLETTTIDPDDKANQPIHITVLRVTPLGASSGDLTTHS